MTSRRNSTSGARGGNLLTMHEAQRWTEFGHFLVEQRERLGLRRRDAAKRAKMSEHDWRALEIGYREEFGGVRVLPNPAADVLERMARALELPVDELVSRIGPRPTPAPAESHGDDAETTVLARRIGRLRMEDRQLIAALIERLLRDA